MSDELSKITLTIDSGKLLKMFAPYDSDKVFNEEYRPLRDEYWGSISKVRKDDRISKIKYESKEVKDILNNSNIGIWLELIDVDDKDKVSITLHSYSIKDLEQDLEVNSDAEKLIITQESMEQAIRIWENQWSTHNFSKIGFSIGKSSKGKYIVFIHPMTDDNFHHESDWPVRVPRED
ncbi:hypothetical protein FHS57_004576 [Runella defluvii]|uniref:Uncharacterized protein n=1 Tax=Runella defluvii TaxID=370973 RepID=A0A7W6ESI9_9BACT|nr:hypothetical protein [Runella defluvii]MBB3840556.1 hypothetical protein [Runella defluvii]